MLNAGSFAADVLAFRAYAQALSACVHVSTETHLCLVLCKWQGSMHAATSLSPLGI